MSDSAVQGFDPLFPRRRRLGTEYENLASRMGQPEDQACVLTFVDIRRSLSKIVQICNSNTK